MAIGHHQVAPGDTLWDIAVAYYGDGSLYQAIVAANPSFIEDPGVIEVGQILHIPEPAIIEPEPAPEPEPEPTPKMVHVRVTWYASYDNNPPGSREIAYRREWGFPTIHNQAAGTGTYDDPLTVAVNRGDYPVGTRFYYPAIRKYGMVEDECGTCRPAGLDWWAGDYNHPDVIDCEHSLTPDGGADVEINPPPGREVSTAEMCPGVPSA